MNRRELENEVAGLDLDEPTKTALITAILHYEGIEVVTDTEFARAIHVICQNPESEKFYQDKLNLPETDFFFEALSSPNGTKNWGW